jgi:crotonobetainyl-CoA:carnitine CoA-transferase CaiB-like acyl-CoA transferase
VDDERFATNGDRVRNADALQAQIEAVLRGGPTAEWVARLDREGVPCAPVQDLDQVLGSRQVEALALVGEQVHPTAGPIPTVRLPLELSGHPTTAPSPPPLLDGDRALLEGLGGGGAASNRGQRRTA